MSVLTETCPVCRDVVYLASGELLEHYRFDPFEGGTVNCLGSGLSFEAAQILASRLRKAAHP